MTSLYEKNVINDFIDLYKDLPCVWDVTSEDYKDNTKKKTAWGILAKKLRELDPAANELSAKKKADHLKYSYQREVKKIKDSKNRTGSAANEVYRPSLWYFDLLSFLEKRNYAKRVGTDTLIEEDENSGKIECLDSMSKKQKQSNEAILEEKKTKLVDTAQALMFQGGNKSSSFGSYVNEKLEKIVHGQREIAEKLISDVLFLAQTNNLHFDSRVETPYHRQDSLSNPGSDFTPSPRTSSEPSKAQYLPYPSQSKFSPSTATLHINSQETPQIPTSPNTSSTPHIQSLPLSPELHHSQPSTSYSYQIAYPQPLHSSQNPDLQSPPPSSDIHHSRPSSSYSYQTTHPHAFHSSQNPNTQSPPPSSDIHHSRPSSSYSYQTTHPHAFHSSQNPNTQSPPPSSEIHSRVESPYHRQDSLSNPGSDFTPSPRTSSEPSKAQYLPYLSQSKFSPSTASLHIHRQKTPQIPTSPNTSSTPHIQSLPLSSELHHSQPSTSYSYKIAYPRPLHSSQNPDLQSPPPSSDIHDSRPSSSYSYQTTHPHAFHSSQNPNTQSPPPSSEIHHSRPSSSYSYQTAHPYAFHSSRNPNTQSPPPSSEIHHSRPSSSYSYQTAHPHAFHSSQNLDSQSPPRPAVSPSTISALHIQSPPPSSDIQRPQRPKSNYHKIAGNQAVLYAEGPAGEILSELLIFGKK